MYWIAQPGKDPIGPMDQGGVIEHLKANGGPGDWLVCAEGTTTWVPAKTAPKIAAEFSPATPPEANDDLLAPASTSNSSIPVLIHLSLYAGFFIPGAGLVLPIVLWLTNRQDPQAEMHGKEVVNWIIFLTITGIISVILMFVIIGWLFILVLAGMALVCPILGAIKASRGEPYRYPMFFRLLK
jgi:uncharacterized protein